MFCVSEESLACSFLSFSEFIQPSIDSGNILFLFFSKILLTSFKGKSKTTSLKLFKYIYQTFFLKTSNLICLRSPFLVLSICFDLGKFFKASKYESSSKFKQHFSFPHCPEIFFGLIDSCWYLAEDVDTDGNLVIHVEQHSSLPQLPIPPTIADSSLIPICLISTLI